MPGRKYSVLYGSKKQRLEALAVDADIYIVNTDGIKVIAKEISDRKDIDVLLIDEVASFRNNSQRSKLLRKFAQPFNIVWAMSGRPLPSSPVDAWAIAKIVTPALAPKYQRQARDELMTQISQYKWLPKPNAVETAFKMMQPAIRFALEDVTELPELIVREPLEIPLSKQQAEVYKRIKTELTAMVEDKTITAHNAGVAMGKLLQVSCGWVYSKAPAFVKLDAEPRINALLDMVESASHKVIVFVPFRHAIEGISEIFTAHEIDHAVMHGDIGADARAVLLNAFQNSDQYRVLLAHPGTISHGVTLTAADTICWYSPVLSLEIFEQANARIRRVGQTKKQQIIRFSGTAVERRVYSLLQSKSNLQDQLLVMLEEATDAS
jgi:SNF2 family DNA or RNA helicase